MNPKTKYRVKQRIINATEKELCIKLKRYYGHNKEKSDYPHEKGWNFYRDDALNEEDNFQINIRIGESKCFINLYDYNSSYSADFIMKVYTDSDLQLLSTEIKTWLMQNKVIANYYHTLSQLN